MAAADSALRDLSKRKVDVSGSFTEEKLHSCAVWNRLELNFEVFEERTSWDLMGGEWATSPRFSGNCMYQGVTLSVAVEFPIYGRLGNIALRSKPK